MDSESPPRDLGRYVLHDRIAAGGMATVHLGRVHGAAGFSRVVAIKRLHASYAGDAHFVQMFLDEARLAARLKHPNVVATVDVIADETEVFLVMEYVLGESLEGLMSRARRVPVSVVSAVMCGVLEGLHSAHDARGDTGEPLEIVHRDVSPHNILVGIDGVARVFDFGIAKATTNTQETREGVIKGKVAYMAPEQVRGDIDRRADVYAAGVILWELLVGRRRHAGEKNDQLFLKLARNELAPLEPPSASRGDVSAEIDAIVARATDPDPDARFATAREMAVALEAAVHPALPREVGAWVEEVAGDRVRKRAALVRRVEGDTPAAGYTKILSDAPVSTSSVRIDAGTGMISLSAAGGVARSVTRHGPTSSTPPPVAPPPRNWTMPAAFLAFTAAMLLVGLRMLSPRSSVPATPSAAPLAAESLAPLHDESNDVSGVRPSTRHEPSLEAPTALGRSVDVSTKKGAEPRVIATRPATTAPRAPARSAEATTPSAVAPTAAAPASPAPPAAKPHCESPFFVGADGVRQVKPECL